MHRCPDEEILAAYFDGLLPPDEERALHREMVRCPECARLVASLGVVLKAAEAEAWDAAPVPPELTRRAQALWPTEPSKLGAGLRLAVRWVEDALAPLADALAPSPVTAGALRGAPAAHPEVIHYALSLGEVGLTVELEPDGPAQVALTVCPTAPPPPGLLLRLQLNGQTRALSSLPAEGATLSALPAGVYQLSLERSGASLGELTLEVAPPT